MPCYAHCQSYAVTGVLSVVKYVCTVNFFIGDGGGANLRRHHRTNIVQSVPYTRLFLLGPVNSDVST